MGISATKYLKVPFVMSKKTTGFDLISNFS